MSAIPAVHRAPSASPARRRRLGAGLAATLAAAVALTACSSTDDAPIDQAGAITVTEPWAKAADHGMTAVFAEFRNDSPGEVTVVAAYSPVSATTELHEVVVEAGVGTMQEKEGGFPIAGGTTYVLSPGADHLMLMDLSTVLEPGDDVPMTITFADGSTLSFDAPIRDFDGAQEDYGDLADHEEAIGHDH